MAAPKPGGFKMSLGGLKNKPGFKAAATQKETKRPRLALGEDEPDDTVKQQEISGWDVAEGGAVDISGPKVKEGPRIIPVQPNRNWRAEAQRKRLANAPHTKQQNGVDPEKMEEEPTVQYGLTIMQKKEATEEAPAETIVEADAMDVDEKDDLTEEQKLEKKALDALVSGSSADNELVIPFQTEDDVLRNDLNEAPDAPTLAAYEATPIEGFGAALLRGMGWKDGEAAGKPDAAKPKETKRRPALLGIGAKEEASVGVELGAFKAKRQGKAPAQVYNPVTLRNKHTGELITEEELKTKLQNQDLVPEEKAPSSRRRHDSDASDDSRRREKRRDKTDDRDRRDDRRRDKHADDSDRRREKRRERDDDYDSERRRDRRRDRSRSPGDDGRREKRRDRYRSRSRDSKDRRRERSRSRDDEERRRRRREREREYDDEREERRRHKDEKYRK